MLYAWQAAKLAQLNDTLSERCSSLQGFSSPGRMKMNISRLVGYGSWIQRWVASEDPSGICPLVKVVVRGICKGAVQLFVGPASDGFCQGCKSAGPRYDRIVCSR